MANPYILAGVGFAVGILSGMGVGGGSLLIVLLTLLGDVPQRTAQGINLLYFLPTAAVAIFIHLRRGNIDKEAALKSGMGGVATAVIFGILAQKLEGETLRKIFALIIFSAGVLELFTAKSRDNPEE
ncbi:MAG TPA: sulfite exporter TauE/SafE family protein [Candidatus Acidoferrum sp.]|nr:sulfite exporter TauE/SafE family protein [Candidatus Acidoferrum sp.]